MKCIINLLITCIIFTKFLFGDIINIPADQSSIQDGINFAVNGDTILVADSLYYENIDFKGKAITITSYFLIDGDSLHIENTIINGSQPNQPDSGSVVRFVSGEDTNSVICGFTITGGTGTLTDGTSRVGGGIFCYSSGATIKHNKITNNTITHTGEARGAGFGSFPFGNNKYTIIDSNLIESNSCISNYIAQGGGVYLPQGKINGNLIRSNLCQGGDHALGGGIHSACDLHISRELYITDNIIENNQAVNSVAGGYGGGIDIYGGIVVYILNNLIRNNHAIEPISSLGGGIRLRYTKAPSIILGNTITNNMSLTGSAGGLGVTETQNIQIIENRFVGNESDFGGAIEVWKSSGTIIKKNEIFDNAADSSGGGIYIQESDIPEINSNFLKGNTAKYGGGVLAVIGNYTFTNNIICKNAAQWGGGIYLAQVSQMWPNHLIEFVNNTITENEADTAGGIAITYDTKLTLLNTICWGNNASHVSEIDMATETWSPILNIAYSDIRFGADSIQVAPGAALNWLNGNIDTDPLFVPGDSLYHLMCITDTSVCLNSGIDALQIGGTWYYAPVEDFGGNSRPLPAGTMPDIGAWESDVLNALEELPGRLLPLIFEFKQNYPNPFNPITKIEYTLPKSEKVKIEVFNLLGQKIETLLNQQMLPGLHQVEFTAENLPSGVYLYRIQAGDFQQVKKMVLLK